MSARRTSAAVLRPVRKQCRWTSPKVAWQARRIREIRGRVVEDLCRSEQPGLGSLSSEERVNIGIRTCPGGDCDSVHSGEVPHVALLPSLFAMNAGYFLIQLASEKDKTSVYKQIGETIRRDANGVKQVAFIGVTNPLNPKFETADEVAADIMEASKYIAKDQLGATDDCRFSPFSIDVKPKHGSPDFARDVAMQKY
ncbi:MAG: hypothetical protein L6R42_007155 [Xanthoria sp. 1 TBL-2021]|nr:MAG: hypothetical protein L6R42_007155 [Xanthoria sp. 1 TBL-2021]